MANELKKILMVDDDEILLASVEMFLKNYFDIISVKSGKEALEYLCKGFVPDLIILDVLMPNMDGWEVFNRMKALSFLHDVPIMFLTSVSEPDDVSRAYKLGAVDYIMKPFNKKDVLTRVKRVLKDRKRK
jgi:putative two-component system response regulator